ncbi:MAG TPA: 30S ribosome-binding factor RbfA [Limnochordales bacterium]
MGVTRSQRLREELKRECSDILRKMKDPRIGFVSVTDAEISQDLRHVKIFVSVFGDAEEKERTLAALEHARGFVRTEIGKRIRLRHTPEIVFRLDDSIERGHRINTLLRSVVGEQRGNDASAAGRASSGPDPAAAGADTGTAHSPAGTTDSGPGTGAPSEEGADEPR